MRPPNLHASPDIRPGLRLRTCDGKSTGRTAILCRAQLRVSTVAVVAAGWLALVPAVALAHENQVIRLGSFWGGFLHPVLGLDHFLAMVSVGIVSSMVGGRAIWTIPGLFVAMMAVGGIAGRADLGLSSGTVETGIALSVILLGVVIAADRNLPVRAVMAAVVFFGFFHGYAHGMEIPDIAGPMAYALGFLLGTALIHLSGVLIGEISRRYAAGRLVLRIAGGVSAALGALFLVGVL